MSKLPPKVPAKQNDEADEAGKAEAEGKRKLDDNTSMVAVNTLLNQALSYMIDNGMVEMDDGLRTLNVMNRDKIVKKADDEGLDDEVFKEIGKISSDMRGDGDEG